MIIIDSSEGLDRQDKRIINIVSNKARSVFIIFNKIDLLEKLKNYIAPIWSFLIFFEN